MRRSATVAVLAAGLLAVAAPALATPTGSGGNLVTVGSPTQPFSQNKQNEPAVAVDANHPNILAAGSNDEVDMEACNAGNDTTCPFTPGVGVSGIYFSFDSGHTWIQPTYTGTTGRYCLGVVGNSDPGCTTTTGAIGTLPWYSQNGLVSDGDPGLAFGPVRGANGQFSWANGSRLYYSNLVSETTGVFKGYEAIGVSRTDNVQAAAAGDMNAWQQPVLISRQNQTTFSDKEQIWADNASSSPYFGNVYVCWANFVGQEKGNAAPAGLQVASSSDGGDTWSIHQVSPASDNNNRNPMDGCTIRTDSHGNAYVFGLGTVPNQGNADYELMSVSSNGGASWSPGKPVVGPVDQPGAFDPVQGRPVIDGMAGARSDLAPAPSVDIANGAPTGANATNRMVMSYVTGALARPDVMFTESTDSGATWATPRVVNSQATDRGYYAAPAISPDGMNVYIVYNAFTTPFRTNTTDPRNLVGVFLHATSSADPATATGGFTEVDRSPGGDPRASSANALLSEFLGDYVYATATNTYGAAVYNDVRNAGDCPAVDAWRAALQGVGTAPRPAVEQGCTGSAATFGNSDIYSFTTAP